MINISVTKRFHRAASFCQPGDIVTDIQSFIDLSEAMDWAESINRAAAIGNSDFHITSVYQDHQNFACFDLSELAEEIPGWDNLPWNEIKIAA